MQQQQQQAVLSVASSSSPSYSNNSSLADIAATVVEEFRAENDSEEFLYVDDLFCGLGGEASEEVVVGKEDIAAAMQDDEDEHNNNNDGDDDEQDNEDQEEFEFTFVPCRDAEELSSLNISTADQIFYNGQIRPVFPIFNREANSSSMCNSSLSLMSSSSGDDDEQQKKISATPPQTIHRLPLRKLLLLSEDQETLSSSSSSCSSSEADELEGIPEGTYCVWRPKEEGKCKKSNSTGYGWRFKRWRLRDLVHRSNSHGKDTFIFLTPSEDKAAGATQTSKTTAAAKSMPNLTHYTKNRSGDKRRHSYLPYRQHLLGFFANVNGFG